MLYYDDSVTIDYPNYSQNKRWQREVNDFDAIDLHRRNCKFQSAYQFVHAPTTKPFYDVCAFCNWGPFSDRFMPQRRTPQKHFVCFCLNALLPHSWRHISWRSACVLRHCLRFYDSGAPKLSRNFVSLSICACALIIDKMR